jgi:hypothetical protein
MKNRGYHKIDYTHIDPFIRQNPTAKYKAFKAKHPGIAISDFTYSVRRRKILGAASEKSDKPRLYMRMWTKENNDPKVASAIRDLIAALNKSGRAHLEMVELANPPLIEVREVTK